MRPAPWRAALFASVLAGCISREMPIDAARSEVQARAGLKTSWHGERSESEEKLRKSLLEKPLTAPSAAQIALLGSAEVQAALERTGVARAALVSALALPNPEADFTAHFHGDEVDLDLGATIDLLDLFLLPAKESAASDDLEASSLQAAGDVLAVAFEAKVALYDYQAAEQTFELRKTVLFASAQSADFAKKLFEAGNITELDALTETALYEEARLAAGRAEAELAAARERVNAVLGLSGAEASSWKAAARLSDPDAFDDPALESKAIEKSLDLGALKRRYAAAAGRANVGWAEGVIPEIRAGLSAERDEGEWGVGPQIGLAIPLFYQGQGAVALAEAEMRTAKSEHDAAAVRIRSQARVVATRLRAARDGAAFYRSTLLPLRDRVVDETLRQYNAMNTGPAQVLQAKRDQIEAAVGYVEVLRQYWLARSEAELLLAGKLPPARGQAQCAGPAASGRAAGDGH